MVVEEVKRIFGDEVYNTIIHRNSKLGEAPTLHAPIVLINASSRGAVNFLNLAQEFLQKNNDDIKSSLTV
jgi:chromosome partitioning protein